MGCILVIIGCTSIGFARAECMRRRLDEMQKIKRYALFIKGEIRCDGRALPDIMIHMTKKADGIWRNFFKSVGEKITDNAYGILGDIWKDETRHSLKGSYLKETEKKEWMFLGENLGYLDIETQLQLLDIFDEHMKESIKQEKEKTRNQSKLSRVLGILCGIFIVILLS